MAKKGRKNWVNSDLSAFRGHCDPMATQRRRSLPQAQGAIQTPALKPATNPAIFLATPAFAGSRNPD
jgi:hypothetical protein